MEPNLKKVLIITPYSQPSACGIWKRAYDDIIALKSTNRYSFTVFSSNILKGTSTILPSEERIDNILFRRFRKWFGLGGSSMFFIHFFSLLRLKPDIIHTHGYRHPHSIQALIAAKILRKKVFITPHAPFEKDSRRSLFLKTFDWLYDHMIGWWEMRLYDKIILTTKWEEKYIRKLGGNDRQIKYISNGIDAAFLSHVKKSDRNLENKKLRAFFMGRLDPVKRLEWIVKAAKGLPDIDFLISGPLSGYNSFVSELPNLIINLNTFKKEDFIETAQNYHVYILPSIRESFGMTMLEAMSQGCIVVTSNTEGAREYITDGVNGFIVNSSEELIVKLKEIQSSFTKLSLVRENAILTAKKFSTKKSGELLIELYSN